VRDLCEGTRHKLYKKEIQTVQKRTIQKMAFNGPGALFAVEEYSYKKAERSCVKFTGVLLQIRQ
jgi:hypothetical protein